jgi:segregation and condensation protein B
VEEYMTKGQKTEDKSQRTEDEGQNSEYRTLEEEETNLSQEDLDSRSRGNDNSSDLNTENTPTVETVVEAVLFASDESLSDARLAKIVETSVKQVRQCVKNLNEKYQANNNAFRIEQIAGGYQMLTLSTYNYWLKQLLRARSDSKLSPAALETLAIIAYKQPVIRADIEAIRGVAAGEVIRTLCYKGLVKIVGRAEILGRPMLYGTTKKFLEVFGLNTLKDLPKIEELKKPPA